MDRRLLELINRNEQQDEDRLVRSLEESIAREMENPDGLINEMKRLGYESVDLNEKDYLFLDYQFVRKADEFEIRKHTKAVVPYFHSHSYYELIYVYKGCLKQYITRGRESVIISERGICLLTPGASHALERPSAGDVVLKISLPVGLVEVIADKAPRLREGKPGGIYYYKAESLRFEGFISGLLEEEIYNKENKAEAVSCYLTLMFLELCREAETISDYALLEEAEKYIGGDFENAGLKGLALRLGYSAGHTGRLLRERLGMNFRELKSRIRMEKAGKLLTETDSSVELIAAELGFKTVSGFYKQFFIAFGITPSKYRSSSQM